MHLDCVKALTFYIYLNWADVIAGGLCPRISSFAQLQF